MAVACAVKCYDRKRHLCALANSRGVIYDHMFIIQASCQRCKKLFVTDKGASKLECPSLASLSNLVSGYRVSRVTRAEHLVGS
jgi:hypothetical protein